MPKAGDGGRRRAPRLPVQIVGSLAGRAPYPVDVVDLSLTGCLVRSPNALDAGAILDLALTLRADPFRAKVRVIESSLDGVVAPQSGARYLAGLEFVGLPAHEEFRLRRFLEDERRRRLRAHPAPE
ncbi:MAG TPA: PilZ domain-containing protein [Vicinamibacteria bacterium]